MASARICGRTKGRLAAAAFTLAAMTAAPAVVSAAPEAHIMRIDPRASQSEGAPTLTTVIEVVQSKPMADALGVCAQDTGDAELSCTANALEKPQALWAPIDFPDAKALMTISVDGTDFPAKFVAKKRWSDAIKDKDEGVGTAWLIIIDASATMDKHFDDARAVAKAFVNGMTPGDIVNIEFVGDRGVAYTSHWIEKAQGNAEVDHFSKTLPSQGSSRALGTYVKQGVTDGFKELGNSGLKVKVPMHQALVVLSDGSSGADPSTTSAFSIELAKYLATGRFPEDNVEMPKSPVPVVSVLFPVVPASFTGSQRDAEVNQARSFVQSLANTEIGGLFSIVQQGEGTQRGTSIVNAVRARFDKMWVVKWEVACVGAEKTQTFKLDFPHSDPQIAGDGSFNNVPVGIDPTVWPLDIDVEKTVAYAEKNPIFPGGTARVYGNFCWGGKKERAELYMIPKNQSLPTSVSGSIDDAKNAQKTLIDGGMRGVAKEVNDQFVDFDVPDTQKFLITKDNKAFTTRIVIYDNGAHRTSAVTQDKVLTLKAAMPPPNYYLYGGAAFGGTIILLLLITVFRSGGKRRGSSGVAAPPPRPASAGLPPPAPMPMPMAPSAPAPSFVSRATLTGSQGIFTVLPSMEMKAGRDGSVCQILLSEPRVSGAHATLKIENGQLFARDDNSNNGTMINGQRIPPGTWTPVGQGAQLRFGPVEFAVNLE